MSPAASAISASTSSVLRQCRGKSTPNGRTEFRKGLQNVSPPRTDLHLSVRRGAHALPSTPLFLLGCSRLECRWKVCLRRHTNANAGVSSLFPPPPCAAPIYGSWSFRLSLTHSNVLCTRVVEVKANHGQGEENLHERRRTKPLRGARAFKICAWGPREHVGKSVMMRFLSAPLTRGPRRAAIRKLMNLSNQRTGNGVELDISNVRLVTIR